METAQKHAGLPSKNIITPFETCVAYIIHSFRSILENKDAINYLYDLRENTPGRIREQKPSLKYLSVTSTVVMTMRQIVGSIVKNQASGGKWLISEAIVDTGGSVYISLVMMWMRF